MFGHSVSHLADYYDEFHSKPVRLCILWRGCQPLSPIVVLADDAVCAEMK